MVLSSGLENGSDLRFSADGRRLVAAGANGSVAIWQIGERTLVSQFRAYEGPAVAAACLGEQRVITGGLDDAACIWNTADAREEWRSRFADLYLRTLDLTADGKTAAWAGFGRKIIVWDLDHNRQKLEISMRSPVTQLKFSPDGNRLAAAGMERWIRLFDARTGAELPAIDIGPPR